MYLRKSTCTCPSKTRTCSSGKYLYCTCTWENVILYRKMFLQHFNKTTEFALEDLKYSYLKNDYTYDILIVVLMKTTIILYILPWPHRKVPENYFLCDLFIYYIQNIHGIM